MPCPLITHEVGAHEGRSHGRVATQSSTNQLDALWPKLLLAKVKAAVGHDNAARETLLLFWAVIFTKEVQQRHQLSGGAGNRDSALGNVSHGRFRWKRGRT